MKKQLFPAKNPGRRFIIYLIGLLILALGITLNTKTMFGVSPIVSIAYCISSITGIKFGIMTFLCYSLFVLIQILLIGRAFQPYQLLQIAVSLITSVFIQFYDTFIPTFEPLWLRIFMLAAAIFCTGLGAALTVGMKLVPNPADGLANVIGQKLKKDFGFGKNVFDFSSLFISLVISLIFAGKPIGIGIGTVCCMIFIGRVIALVSPLVTKLAKTLE